MLHTFRETLASMLSVRSLLLGAALAFATIAPLASAASVKTKAADEISVTYHTVQVDGLGIFYREAGSTDRPTVVLLHGFPSSSRMYNSLIPVLASRYHVVAPDYPGFGQSDAPAPDVYPYTFDHLAETMDKLFGVLGIHRYALFVQDYGGPVGFRLALCHPERVAALVVQNAVSHEEGLGPLWVVRRQYWANREAYADKLRANLVSLDAARQRHVGSSPHPERYDPDTWTDEFAFLSKPGEGRIQEELFYDYRNNVASYPAWQSYLQQRRPPLLVLWGKYDPSFTVFGATAYQKTLPSAEVHILDAGHFALDEKSGEVGKLTLTFLRKQLH